MFLLLTFHSAPAWAASSHLSSLLPSLKDDEFQPLALYSVEKAPSVPNSVTSRPCSGCLKIAATPSKFRSFENSMSVESNGLPIRPPVTVAHLVGR